MPLLEVSRSPLPHWTEGNYWRESQRPLTSLVFILPGLAAYEGGVLLLGPRAMRNGADVWLRELLDLLGFGQYFLLPVLTIALLLAWHHTLRQSWHVSLPVLAGMLVECVLFALVLITIARLQGDLLHSWSGGSVHSVSLQVPAAGRRSVLGLLVTFLGAGIYEELLFRLTLIPIAAGAWRLAGGAPRMQTAAAIVATSLLFSAAHYLGAQGEHFTLYSFVFRFLAGGFFGLLFVYRGFGIAAGTHALYDIFVGIF